MGVTVEWYDEEKNILWNKFIDQWTWEELFVSEAELMALATQNSNRIDTIIDLTDADYLIPPQTITNFINMAHRFDVNLPNWGISVIVSTNKLPHIIFSIVRKLSPATNKHYRIASSIEEAVTLIFNEREQMRV